MRFILKELAVKMKYARNNPSTTKLANKDRELKNLQIFKARYTKFLKRSFNKIVALRDPSATATIIIANNLEDEHFRKCLSEKGKHEGWHLHEHTPY